MKKWSKIIPLCLLFFIIDWLSKYLVYMHVPKMSWLHPLYPYGGVGIFKDFFGMSLSINYVQNEGAAWGIFAGHTNLLFALRIIIVVFLILYVAYKKMSFLRAMPFCLVITGAIGNIIDMMLYGHVVDMIHVKFGSYSYPVFNFADILITVGIIWLIINSFCRAGKKI